MSEPHAPHSPLKFAPINNNRRILVVEDEFINQELLKLMLSGTYEVMIAGTGAEALKEVSAHFDTLSLVLLDLNLPDMHGLDVLRQLRADSRSARLPVIVMTAEKDAEVESLTLGAIDFIPKPYPQQKVVLARVLRTIELYEDQDTIRGTERDRLTGLYTREFFYRYAGQFDLYYRDLPTDALFIDINQFHRINDRYGKAYGNEVLKKVGESIRGAVQDAGGIVCRLEADTFLVYCPHRDDYAAILDAASVTLPHAETKELRVRLRMGVYADVDKTVDIERRFDRAKLAAETVRNTFGKSVGIYDDALREAEVFSEQLIEDFRAAIQENQFQVYYQPKYNIRGEKPVLCSAEALVRWKHPKLGMISPGTFIPLFEQNGLIPELDSWVWQETARQVRDWKDRLGKSVPVSINVSRINMYDPGLADKLVELVHRSGLTFDDLLLEVTESAYTSDSEQIIERVKQLRQYGFLIEMDDFGSGYSSLSMLSSLPIDALKLDMQFLRHAFRDEKDTRLLEAVILLAKSLEVPTIAEGVETAEQLQALRSMGCDIAQGYYFSRPVPPEEFEHFITESGKAPLLPAKTERTVALDRFTYEALHDPLTKLYNQTAFEILFHDSDQDHIAVLLTEIDGFSGIRKEKGKEYADRTALHVANVLRTCFRSSDHLCRLSENRFAVIMTRMSSTMQPTVIEKTEQLSTILSSPEHSETPVSLSTGFAFSDVLEQGSDVFREAYAALDQMKKAKRN